MPNSYIDSIRLSGTTYQIQGSGGGGTVDPSLDPTSTNPVENKAIYNKFDEVEQVTAAALNELNDAISGKVDTSTYNTYTAATDTAIASKFDASGITAYSTSQEVTAEIEAATSGKVDTTDFETYSGAVESRIVEDEEVTASGLNALNDKFGGLKLMKITQVAYDALTVKDNNTLYIVID